MLPQSSALTPGEAPAGTDRRRRRLDPGVCPECDSADTRRVVVRTDYVLYVRCDACGALTVHQKPGVPQLGQSLDSAS